LRRTPVVIIAVNVASVSCRWKERRNCTANTRQDPNGPVTLRTSKFITNRLLNRKQFVVTVTHPTRANLSRVELGERLAQLYKSEKERVVVFGLRTKFGGGVTQGFGLIYDDEDSQKKFEPRYRLVRVRIEGGWRNRAAVPTPRHVYICTLADIPVRPRYQGRACRPQAPQGAQEPPEEGEHQSRLLHCEDFT
jgi:small subunit ribosomal protein S24e